MQNRSFPVNFTKTWIQRLGLNLLLVCLLAKGNVKAGSCFILVMATRPSTCCRCLVRFPSADVFVLTNISVGRLEMARRRVIWHLAFLEGLPLRV